MKLVAPYPSTGIHGVFMGAPTNLGSPTPMVWLVVVHMTSLLGWRYLLPEALLIRHSVLLESLTSWGLLYIFSFTFTLIVIVWYHSISRYLQGSWPCHILPGLAGFLLKFGWKPPLPWNSGILHACKTSTTTWVMSGSATSWKWLPGPLEPWLLWPLCAWIREHWKTLL
jgi:hypothetical protein